jgi:hypothetical protein
MLTREAVSTKSVLAAIVVVGVVAVAGVTLLSDGDTGAAVNQVPAGADTVVRLDMTITNDRTTQILALAGGASIPAGDADNASQFGATIRNRTGIDPRPAEELVVFGVGNESTPTNTSYVGAILHTDAETATAVAGLQNATGAGYAERTVDGQTVYAPTNRSGYWIGVIGEGQLVFARTRAPVTDTLNVTAGNAQRFDGQLRTAYDGTPNGTVRFATTSPERLLPANAGFLTNVQLYRDLRSVGGSYYIESGRTGIELQLRANNDANARSVAQAINGTVAVLPSYVENETAADAVRAVHVSQQGSTVTVSYEAPFGEFEQVIRYLFGTGL